jgi:GST-like protein
MFGQFGHFFKYARDKCDHPYPLERYTNEAKRLLGVLEHELSDKEYLIGEYTIADIATAPWVSGLSVSYNAADALQLSEFPRVKAWVDRIVLRPAYQTAKDVAKSG